MDLIERILSDLPTVAKPQMKFLVAMFAALFAFQGKANRVNLHRYGAPPPRTQYRQQQKSFDATAFNLAALADQGVNSPVFGSFNEAEEARVAQMDQASIINAAVSLAQDDQAEAVFLSTRIFVMSANPGKIAHEITVDLPSPRSAETRLSRPYQDLVAEVSQLLRSVESN